MNLKKLFFSTVSIMILVSCSKDDGPTTPVQTNSAPVILAQAFTASEGINDSFVIGTVKATDADGDALTFSIATNSDSLFEISGAGALSLASGKALSFATKASHTIAVSVSDGTVAAKANVTITVTEVVPTNETPEISPQSFEAGENIASSEAIGTVTATDAEGDALTFLIVDDASNLFQISESGELFLADGSSLDFATAEEHTLTIGVSDGNTEAQATITVTVIEGISFEAQTFEVEETISDTFVIGTVMATDPQGDNVTFAITMDDSGLFEITTNGELTLVQKQGLDADSQEQHTITISASDPNGDIVEVQITINVEDRFEGIEQDPEWFVTTWTTNQFFGGETVKIAVDTQYTYDFIVEWGDGSIEQFSQFVADNEKFEGSATMEHTYESQGTYTVAIKGNFPYFAPVIAPLLNTIEQWGNITWQSFRNSFAGCSVLRYNATDIPDLSQVMDMSGMFEGASDFNGDLSGWDTRNVVNMRSMFERASVFEGPQISGWDTRNVVDMSSMFLEASSFYGDLSGWNTSRVTDMSGMFRDADSFNAPIGTWNVGNVTNMSAMFALNNSFDRDLPWDTSNVTDMSEMFASATNFDRSLGDWDISSIQNMELMLTGSGLSPVHYDSTLIGWNNNLGVPDNISLGADGLTYCSVFAGGARGDLINNKGWMINDSGENCNP